MVVELAPCFHISAIDKPQQLIQLASELRQAQNDESPDLECLLGVLDAWSKTILESPAAQIPGAIFLSLWLRRSTLLALLHRELGPESLDSWNAQGKNRFRRFPVGLVAHWPAANVPTLPILSPICALLGGNVCLVRVPSAFVESMRVLLLSLSLVPGIARFAGRLRFVTFPNDRRDLQEAMASASDGAMIWGGQEAVDTLRRLPFPYWARLMVFGPRMSVAALDRGAWRDQNLVSNWCQRLARDVWQFEQAACSSPQILFVEHLPEDDLKPLIAAIESAFRRENDYHPRESIDPSLSTTILRARAEVQVNSQAYGVFPLGTDWTLLVYRSTVFPTPTQGRTLHIVPVRSLEDIVPMLDGSVQTLGLGMTNLEAEMRLVEQVGRNGVDRIVRIGMMHVFDSPWDGYDLVQPMTRKVRHLLSQSNL